MNEKEKTVPAKEKTAPEKEPLGDCEVDKVTGGGDPFFPRVSSSEYDDSFDKGRT